MCTLNENIRTLRTARGISQVEFATQIGVTKQCVSNWENDNVQPSIEMLVKLADFFGVTTDYLLGRTPNAPLLTDGLSAEQIAHLRLLIKDLELANLESKRLRQVISLQKIFDPNDRT